MDQDSRSSDSFQSFSYCQNSSVIESSSDSETELLPPENALNQNYIESNDQNVHVSAEQFVELYEKAESIEGESSTVRYNCFVITFTIC